MASPYASPWARLGGYLVDWTLAYVIQVVGGFLGGAVAAMLADSSTAIRMREATEDGMMLGFVFWAFVWWFLNYGILQGLSGATFGKLVTGVRVVNRRDGAPIGVPKSLGRSLAYIVSALPVYVGFLALLWDQERRCWHDRICGTVVIRKGAAYAGVEGAAPAAPAPSAVSGEDRPVFPNAA